MPKRSMEWHRQALNISEVYLLWEEERLLVLQESVSQMREHVIFHRAQIAEADRRGADGFDPERFMVVTAQTDKDEPKE